MKAKILSTFLILCLCLAALSGCNKALPERRSIPAVDNTGAARTREEKTKTSDDPDITDDSLIGELLYSGETSADNIESLSVSFILSEDKSFLHDFAITITGFKGSAVIPGATVSVELSGQTQTAMQDIPINYELDNRNIDVSDSSIESLKFNDDGSADLVLTYCFKQTVPQSYEIPVPGITIRLTSEHASEADSK